jgi:surface-anchored protein
MKKPSLLTALLISSALTLSAQTRLTNEHVDIGIGYEDGEWDLHIHDDTNDIEYAPDEAIFQIGMAALTTVPADARFSFLGNSGESVWVVPQIQNPALPFLGIAAEEVETGIFAGDTVRLTLRDVDGPGHFALWLTDPFGNPNIRMNTRDGITEDDFASVFAGGHTEFNWAFSEPGTYRIDFQASGLLLDENILSLSELQTYTFEVIPEPGTWALMATGLLTVIIFGRRGARKPWNLKNALGKEAI